MYLFCDSVLSYFAKPNFIVYDEWFDNDFKKIKLDFKNKKITGSSKIHEFFYEQSNYKVGASENNLQIDINKNSLITIIFNIQCININFQFIKHFIWL